MIEVILDDRLGKKVRVKCNEDDTIGDLKKLAAAQVKTVLVGICVAALARTRRCGIGERAPHVCMRVGYLL